jgi:hypothetical protein
VAPGNTPYVQSDADLAAFLARLHGFLTLFQRDLHGRFVTPQVLRADLEQLAPER